MKPVFTYFTVFLLLFGSITATYGQVTFEPLGGPFGINSIQNIISDNNGHLFRVSNQIIHLSLDNGDTWTECMSGITSLNYSSFFLKSPDGEIYFYKDSNSATLYKYDALTNSWNLRNSSYDAYDVDAQGNFWAVDNLSYNNLHFSEDGGSTFQNIPMDIPINGWLLELASYNEAHNLIGVGYGTDQRLYHFTKSGIAKLVLDQFINFLDFNQSTGTAYTCTYNETFRSIDGGLTWSKIDFDSNPTTNTNIDEVFFGSNGETWAYDSGLMYHSMDDGVTWTVSEKFKDRGNKFFLSDDNTWFQYSYCDYMQFTRSTDNGYTWTDLSSQFLEPTVKDLLKDGSNNLYAHTCHQNAFEVSFDNGNTWEDYKIITDSAIVLVENLVMNQNGVRIAKGSDSKIYRSLDNGINWAILTIPNQTSPFFNFQVDMQGNFYCNSLSTIIKSTDGGDTWTTLNIHTFSDINLVFSPNGDFIWLDEGYSLYYSAASDTSFTIQLPANIPQFFKIRSIFCAPSGTFLIYGYDEVSNVGGVYRTTNINSNWEIITDSNNIFYGNMVANSIGHLFSFGLEEIYRSLDDGLTWQPYAILPTSKPGELKITADNYLYLCYYGEVIFCSNVPTTETNFIIGNSWLDLNNNCQEDQTETPFSYTKVKAAGNNDYIGFVRPNGSYTVNVSAGNYQVNIVPPNALYAPCNADATVVLDATHDSVSVDMPLRVVEFCPYLSVNISTPFLRRCFENTYSIQYKNEGTSTAQNAYIEITLDSLLEFIDSSLPIFSQNGHVYTFQVGNLDVNQSGAFWLKTKVSCMAELGQTHCISANIFPNVLCGTPLVNRTITEECRENIGSFDPNDKRSFVNGKENPSNILQNTEIEYFIRFQNTGTDTAFRVVVEDRITGLLDLNTLTPLVSSHPFSIEVNDQRNIRFVFDNIMLPDSNINEAASHGFIKFRINQMPDLQNGEVISNLADIFFDFNAPVRTNTSNIVVGITNTYTPSKNYQVSAYPNPFNDQISFKINTQLSLSGQMTLSIVDVLGKQITREEFIGDNHNTVVSELQKGIYFYKIENGNGVIGTGKLMKM
jgi:photosystem II stability/assembly factor-like uncharacterized protein